LGEKLFPALRQGQDVIGADNELRSLELFQAAVDHVRITMEEEYPQ
jgi:hypothetical protein